MRLAARLAQSEGEQAAKEELIAEAHSLDTRTQK